MGQEARRLRFPLLTAQLASAAAPQVPEPPPERLADERPLPTEPVLRYLRRHRPHLPVYAPAAGERGAGGAVGRARL